MTTTAASTTARSAPPLVARGAARRAAIVPATVVTQLVVALVIAALAASRADAASSSPVALIGLVVGTAVSSTLLTWPAGLYAGALDVLDRDMKLDCGPHCPGANDTDPFDARALRRRAAGLAALVGAWALASATLLAVVLDNRPARAAVIVAALVGVGASAAVVVDGAARHRGAHAAMRLRDDPPAPVPLRRRAWREIALPLALAQIAVNAGAAWLLFHDDTVHNPFAPHALTRSTALADVPVIITVLALVFAVAFAGVWGGVDARLGRLTLDDPDAQRVRAAEPIGIQGIVYVGALGFVLASGLGYVLPSSPSLVQVMLARGAFAGLLALLFAAAGYVRGALNALAEQ